MVVAPNSRIAKGYTSIRMQRTYRLEWRRNAIRTRSDILHRKYKQFD
jgi:hypothetical protein